MGGLQANGFEGGGGAPAAPEAAVPSATFSYGRFVEEEEEKVAEGEGRVGCCCCANGLEASVEEVAEACFAGAEGAVEGDVNVVAALVDDSEFAPGALLVLGPRC